MSRYGLVNQAASCATPCKRRPEHSLLQGSRGPSYQWGHADASDRVGACAGGGRLVRGGQNVCTTLFAAETVCPLLYATGVKHFRIGARQCPVRRSARCRRTLARDMCACALKMRGGWRTCKLRHVLHRRLADTWNPLLRCRCHARDAFPSSCATCVHAPTTVSRTATKPQSN